MRWINTGATSDFGRRYLCAITNANIPGVRWRTLLSAFVAQLDHCLHPIVLWSNPGLGVCTRGAEWSAKAKTRPSHPPAASPVSGFLESALTPGPGGGGGESVAYSSSSPTPTFRRRSRQTGRVSPLTLAAWNVRSLLDNPRSNRPERRTALVARELARYKVDIAALSETRFSEQGQQEEVGAGYTFFWSGRPKAERRDAGVAFAIRTDIVG
nr:unnamed protein product [Spirometra erinaceieuropaei]